jgi:hypothetical protein
VELGVVGDRLLEIVALLAALLAFAGRTLALPLALALPLVVARRAVVITGRAVVIAGRRRRTLIVGRPVLGRDHGPRGGQEQEGGGAGPGAAEEDEGDERSGAVAHGVFLEVSDAEDIRPT